MYGIKNCDSVKKARRWLDHRGIDYLFHDFKTDGIDKSIIDNWLKNCDWQILVNKRSTTWRQLPDPYKQDLDKNIAVELMLEHPTLIKRPVFIADNFCLVGFKEAEYQRYFAG